MKQARTKHFFICLLCSSALLDSMTVAFDFLIICFNAFEHEKPN